MRLRLGRDLVVLPEPLAGLIPWRRPPGHTATGDQGTSVLFASPGTTRRTRPAEAARIPHRLITELTMLATATTVTKRRAPDGAPQTSPLFEEAGLSAANDG